MTTAAAPAPLAIDRVSLLVDAPGDATLEAVEAALAAEGLTLGLDEGASTRTRAAEDATTVGDWLARGAPGAPSVFADPADHVVAGLTLVLLDGRTLVVRPEPRRAVGPDLVALAVGANGRFGRITRASLRVHLRDAPRPRLPLPATDLDPPVSDAESRLLDAITRELAR